MNVTEIKLMTPGAIDLLHASFKTKDVVRTDRFILKKATGLDAEDIMPQFYGRAQGTNFNYYNMVPKARVVTLTIKLNPQYNYNQTVGQLRDVFYKAVSYNRQGKIELRFMDDEEEIGSLIGFIRKIESSQFEAEAEITVTFEFSDPFIRSNDHVIIQGSSPVHALGMPNPEWEDNDSTAPHGFKMELVFTIPTVHVIDSLTIHGIHNPLYAPFKIDYHFEPGQDKLYFSSEYNNRYLYVERTNGPNVQTINLADKIVKDSIWPIMLPGKTKIGFSNAENATPEIYIERILYRTAYWGV